MGDQVSLCAMVLIPRLLMSPKPDEIRLKPTKDGSFIRPDSAFRSFVSKDPDSQFPAEKDRYVLYLSPGCPWVGHHWAIHFHH